MMKIVNMTMAQALPVVNSYPLETAEEAMYFVKVHATFNGGAERGLEDVYDMIDFKEDALMGLQSIKGGVAEGSAGHKMILEMIALEERMLKKFKRCRELLEGEAE